MRSLLNVVIPRKQLEELSCFQYGKFSEASLYSPIMCDDKVIGFVCDINEKTVTAALWTTDFSVLTNGPQREIVRFNIFSKESILEGMMRSFDDFSGLDDEDD